MIRAACACLALAAFAAAAIFAPAIAKSIDDCEKISAADAYNRCLASFGPKRGQRPPSGAVSQRAEGKTPPATRSFARAQKRRNGVHSEIIQTRNASGRVTMQFFLRPRSR